MRILAVAAAAALGLSAAWALQDRPETMKPQREHEWLKPFEGDWEVTSKFTKEGEKTMESKGTETAHLKLGGFWLFFDHKGQHEGKPFEGHGMIGYDPAKRKYVGVWVDSLSPHWTPFEGEADAAGKALTLRGKGTDLKTGKECPLRWVLESGTQDHRMARIYKEGEDGKETLMGEMHYTRKKEAR